ncbi:MAG: glycosyltransferase [Candidatus Saccharibacteria bacterium]|nr:glycosyltransferase [Candidatus Saccharibacteria bacterium]
MKVSECTYCGASGLESVTHRLDGNVILRCAECGLMMVETIPDDLDAVYEAEYFSKAQDTKTGYTDYFASPPANLIGKYAFARLFVSDPTSHLDLGCADGSLMEIFREAGFDTEGIDISAAAIAIAKAKGLDATRSNLEPFPAKLRPAHLVTAFDLLEHTIHPGKVLQQLHEHLEPGGYLAFSTLAVTQVDTAEYWFNNSLEHTVYFTEPCLERILTDTFGKGNFAFTQVESGGVREFWGVAKRGRLQSEAKVIKHISDGTFDLKDAQKGYLISLFYNQAAMFGTTRKVIEHFQAKWTPAQLLQARFYLNYYQGKFEAAVRVTANNRHLLAAHDSIFWQALSHAQEAMYSARQSAATQESTEEILSLREQVFQLKGQVHTLRHYHIIGPLIRFRERLGPIYRQGIDLRIRSVHAAKRLAAKVLPAPVRQGIKRMIKYDYSAKFARVRVITNRPWNKNAPLVSVVIPYYNRADTIDDTIGSLHIQTFTDFEVLIVDDGSTDPVSTQKLKDLNLKGLDAQIIHQKNQGVSAARNTGISKAKGKYVICLDSDDVLEPTFIEKASVLMETSPDVSIATSDREDFGVIDARTVYSPYDPQDLWINNMIITAAAFRKEAWRASGGYKSGIGYEDWEYWINLGENGYWGQVIPEPLFRYRTSMQSRFIGDKDIHFNNIKKIRELHPRYKQKVSALQAKRQFTKRVVEPASAFTNLDNKAFYANPDNGRPNILITVPWMTFGGAETLIYNDCRQIKDEVNFSCSTGLKSKHEWEYKFKEITPRVYHMANLFEDPALYIEFVANYIETRQIDILHVIHNGFTFDMLAELKSRFPDLKVAVTLFNDRVEYFDQSIAAQQYIDAFSSDNEAVAGHFEQELGDRARVRIIPNGINCYDEFSPVLFDRASEREALGIAPNELAVLFVGRFSPEKNPDVFVRAAGQLLAKPKNRSLRFFLIGDGPTKKDVEDLMAEINRPEIINLGYQSEPARYLSAADIFVLPSSIEGFPLSILEAMAMRLAVVVSRVGAIPEVIDSGRDGVIVTPGSDTEIAAAIGELLRDRDLLENMKTAARQKVESQYSTIALGRNYLGMYRDLSK